MNYLKFYIQSNFVNNEIHAKCIDCIDFFYTACAKVLDSIILYKSWFGLINYLDKPIRGPKNSKLKDLN